VTLTIAVVDSLIALDPSRPIREADIRNYMSVLFFGNLAIFAAIRGASSLVSIFAAERRPRRTPKAISAMPKSWKPSPRHGGRLYYLVGDFASQEIAFVSLIEVFAAIVQRTSNCSTDQGGGKRRVSRLPPILTNL
jgi:hypothetical protein